MAAPYLDHEGQHPKGGTGTDEPDRSGGHVEGPFQEHARGRPALPERDERDAPDLVQAGPGHCRAQPAQPRHDADIDARAPAVAQNRNELLVTVSGETHDDPPDCVPGDYLSQVSWTAEHWQPWRTGQRRGVDEPARTKAQLGVLAQQAENLL